MADKKQEYDCFNKRILGEPYFILLARDPQFAELIEAWVARREAGIRCGSVPASDIEQVTSAKVLLAEGAAWRLKNNGAWRRPPVDAELQKGSIPETTLNIPMPSGAVLPPIKPTLVSAPVLLCSNYLRKDGQPAPSTCALCGIGPCRFPDQRTGLYPPFSVGDPISAAYKGPMADAVVTMGKLRTLPPIPTAVFHAIRQASSTVGVDLATMLAFAQIESSFNPNASAKAGTAAGLYQFTHATWSEMVNSCGSKYKVTESMVYDPSANALMAAERLKMYADYLRLHNILVDAGKMYCLHFLGMLGGVKLINAAAGTTTTTSPAILAQSIFPVAAAANPDIFGNKKPLSVTEVYNELYSKAQDLTDAYTADALTGGPVVTI